MAVPGLGTRGAGARTATHSPRSGNSTTTASDVALIASSRVEGASDLDPKAATPMSADNPFPAERTAVVTGAASPRGIGRATADRLARDGWSIAILDLDGGAAERTAAEIGGHPAVASLAV